MKYAQKYLRRPLPLRAAKLVAEQRDPLLPVRRAFQDDIDDPDDFADLRAGWQPMRRAVRARPAAANLPS